jgi:hypothetical protein
MQCLDGPALIHRAMAFGNLIERQREIEYFPGWLFSFSIRSIS